MDVLHLREHVSFAPFFPVATLRVHEILADEHFALGVTLASARGAMMGNEEHVYKLVDGPKSGDVVIWSVKGVAETATSYLVFKVGDTAAPRHYEGQHVWGQVFTDARQYAQQRTVWLREGLEKPRRLIASAGK